MTPRGKKILAVLLLALLALPTGLCSLTFTPMALLSVFKSGGDSLERSIGHFALVCSGRGLVRASRRPDVRGRAPPHPPRQRRAPPHRPHARRKPPISSRPPMAPLPNPGNSGCLQVLAILVGLMLLLPGLCGIIIA